MGVSAHGPGENENQTDKNESLEYSPVELWVLDQGITCKG